MEGGVNSQKSWTMLGLTKQFSRWNIDKEYLLDFNAQRKTGMDTHTKALLKAMSPESVKDLVRNELQTYDADKTGRTDYALGSSGFENMFPRFQYLRLKWFYLAALRRRDTLDEENWDILGWCTSAETFRYTSLPTTEYTSGYTSSEWRIFLILIVHTCT